MSSPFFNLNSFQILSKPYSFIWIGFFCVQKSGFCSKDCHWETVLHMVVAESKVSFLNLFVGSLIFFWDALKKPRLAGWNESSWSLNGVLVIGSRFFNPVFIFEKKIFWIRAAGALLCCDKWSVVQVLIEGKGRQFSEWLP